MENLIPVVNKLQDAFGAVGNQAIDLPQIVVVGSQSSGKSSVLESIVGRDFLPRGTGIVTRRPLVLQLYTLPPVPVDSERVDEEWGEFLHLPGKKFYDFDEIRGEIQRETDRLTGRNKGISRVSINLKIYSRHVLNLTLVDLPGVTKVPTGDQPEDVEEQIRSMCLEFICNPNAIILAVSAANQDLANSDGLKLARSVDPDGDRTIGVLTKIDIMDAGTDCMDVLCNRVIPLKRGYIAVKNRSQQDIQQNLPIRSGLQKELAFFQSHPRYRTVIAKCGTENLSIALNQILMRHIKDCLPEIKSKIMKMLDEVQNNIELLGDTASGNDRSAQSALLLAMLSKFVHNINICVDGKAAASSSISVDINELYGGARISYIFTEVFGTRLRDLNPFDGLDDNDIRTAIANANGTRPSLFVPEISFDLLVRRQIAKLEQPGLQCVDYVFDEMQRTALQCETAELARFPELREKTFEIVNAMLRDCLKPTQKMISNIVKVELAYINTSHPDFVGGKQAIAQITKRQQQAAQHLSQGNGEKGHSNSIANEFELTQGGNKERSISHTSHPQAAASATNHSVPATSSQPAPPAPSFASPPPTGQGASSAAGGGGFFSFLKPAPSTPLPSTLASAPITSNISANSASNYDGLMQKLPMSQQTNDSIVKLATVPENIRVSSSMASNDWGRRETEIIKVLIESYFTIVKKTFMDMVPKTIMHFLVNEFRERLQTELVSNLYRENMLSQLLRENDDIEAKRKACQEMREVLRRALEIVNEVRSGTSSTTGRSSLAGTTSSVFHGATDEEEELGFVSRRNRR